MDDSLKNNNFDLLRILAAAQVLVAHGYFHLGMPRPSGIWLINAFPGVPIFFAMSGFLISASFERSLDVATYARNRCLRILPGLWCCVLLTVAVSALCGVDFFNVQAPVWLASQLVGVIYTPEFLSRFGFGSYNGSLWTIPIELQFYFLLPVLYVFLPRKQESTTAFYLVCTTTVIMAFLCDLFISPLAENEHEPIAQKLLRYSFIPHIYLFLAGVLLQRLDAHRLRWIRGKGLYWLAVYLALHYLLPPSAATYLGETLLLAAAAISLAYTAPSLSAILLRGNDLSYGVYIYHGLIINVMVEAALMHQPRYMLLLGGCTFLAAYLSWTFVEKPFLHRKRQTLHASPL